MITWVAYPISTYISLRRIVVTKRYENYLPIGAVDLDGSGLDLDPPAPDTEQTKAHPSGCQLLIVDPADFAYHHSPRI
jgi:hypothetical protein